MNFTGLIGSGSVSALTLMAMPSGRSPASASSVVAGRLPRPVQSSSMSAPTPSVRSRAHSPIGREPSGEREDALGRERFQALHDRAIAPQAEDARHAHAQRPVRRAHAEDAGNAVDEYPASAARAARLERGEARPEIAPARTQLETHFGREFHQAGRRCGRVFRESAVRILLELFHRLRRESEVAAKGGIGAGDRTP